ncbi:MAG TPA: site-specific integrase [Puia sp.]|nr:site-specific integrase [Puia sp.]
METNFSVLFHGKKNIAKNEKLITIYMRVTANSDRYVISTHRIVEATCWSKEAGKVKGNSEEAKSINSYLDTLKHRAYQYQKELILEEKPINAKTFKEKWKGTKEKPRLLLEIFRGHNEQVKALIKKDYAPATLTRYETTLKHTKSFLLWKFKQSDIDIKKLNFEFITEYEFWLKSVRKCNHNSTMKYIGNLKKITNKCVRNGWLVRDPFLGFSMAKKEVERIALTEEEIKIIYEKDFQPERLGQVRDIFLFCCYTGLAYADVKKLKRTEISNGVDGEKWIFTSRQKTDSSSRIPLLPMSTKIISKYESHPQCVNENKVLPVLTNQKMNSYLKEIMDVCGINKNLTFHIARHTFATTITLSNGVPIETVSKMLGHKNLKTTQHYAKILDKKISDDMRNLKLRFAEEK